MQPGKKNPPLFHVDIDHTYTSRCNFSTDTDRYDHVNTKQKGVLIQPLLESFDTYPPCTTACDTYDDSYSTSSPTGKSSHANPNQPGVINRLLFDLDVYGGTCSTVNIQDNQYSVFDVPGDGDCFFSSLSLSLLGNFSRASYYRHLICSQICNNWDSWADLVTLSHDVAVKHSAAYSNHMVIQKGWATAAEIKAASELLNLNITIWLRGTAFHEDRRQFYTKYTEEAYTNANAKASIHLLLTNSHFSVLFQSKQHTTTKTQNLTNNAKSKYGVVLNTETNCMHRTHQSTNKI